MIKYQKPRSVRAGFINAFQGLFWAFKEQLNFKIHTTAFFVVLVTGWICHLSNTEWLFVLTTSFMILTFELVNTSLEQATDAITEEYNPLIKRAKDVSAASVLIFAIYAILVGTIIFGPKLLALVTKITS